MSEPTDAPAPPILGMRPSRALWAVVGAFIVIASIYSVIVPPFETPDEIWHFAFVQHLASGQGLPVSEANTQALWRQQGVQAPGYYLAAAALTAWIDQSDFPGIYARANPHAAIGEPGARANRNYLVHHADEGWPWTGSILALHITRLFSVLLGAVTVWAGYRAVAPILGEWQALTGATVFAFIPQFLFISAAASNDNAVNALAALVLWRLVVLVVPAEEAGQGPDMRAMRRGFLLIGLLLGLAALSKLSALGLVALTGLAVLLYAWRARSVRPLFEAVVWIGLPVAAIAAWWYVRNWRLYGDPLAWNVWQNNILLRVDTADWRTIAAELTSLERSFWGLFGWLNVAYPDIVYLLLRAVTLLIFTGCLVALARWVIRSRRVDARWLGGLLLLLWLLILTVSWLRFMRIAPAAQGRYFFPAAPTLMMLIAIGLHGWRLWTLNWLVAGFVFALSVATPFWVIAPAYRPPAAHTTQLSIPLNVDVGERFSILGVEAEPAVLQPGDEATVRVTWRADDPAGPNYSVFVHLVDEDGLIIAQKDTMPGGGLRPTSQWTPGETRTEAYIVELPSTAYTPNRAQWLVGLYDASSGERLPMLAPNGETSGAAVELLAEAVRFGHVEIRTPPGSVPNPLDSLFQDNLTLAGYEVSSRRLAPGDEVSVTLHWQARGPVSQDYVAFVHLLDGEQTMHGGHDDLLGPPTTTWTQGEEVTDTHTFTVPDSAAPGLYQLEIGLYTRPDFDRLMLEEGGGAEGADRLLLGPLRVVQP